MARRFVSRHVAAALVVGAALLLLVPAPVAAHAELLETTPPNGETVESTPGEIVAVFSEGLLPNGSGISVRDSTGERLASGDVDPDDATRLVITEVPELAPGDYEVRWQARSDDGHLERDTWTFTVAPAPTPSPTPSPTPTQTASPSAPPSASATPAPSLAPGTPSAAPPSIAPSPSADGGDPAANSDVILPILAALGIVAVGGAVLLGRRGRPTGTS